MFRGWVFARALRFTCEVEDLPDRGDGGGRRVVEEQAAPALLPRDAGIPEARVLQGAA